MGLEMLCVWDTRVAQSVSIHLLISAHNRNCFDYVGHKLGIVRSSPAVGSTSSMQAA